MQDVLMVLLKSRDLRSGHYLQFLAGNNKKLKLCCDIVKVLIVFFDLEKFHGYRTCTL